MDTINKQKFLAELGKLLTFMYEEDRQTALAMYVKMFEDTEDEQALLQALVSPTRQAVIVARAYNAKMRKLQVEAQSREETGERVEDEATPDFILAIHKVYEEAVPDRSVGSAPMEDQFSLFEEDAFLEEDADAQPDENAEEAPVETEPDLGVNGEEAAKPEEPAVTEEAEASAAEPEASEDAEAPEDDVEAAGAPEAAAAAIPAAAVPLFVPDDDEGEAEEAPVDKDALDDFLADFSIEDDPLSPEAEEEDALDEEEALSDKTFELNDEADEEEDAFVQSVPTATVRKARPLLLILYLILAIPITLALICVLLIPTLFFLGLAVSAIAAGAAFFVTAFSGFPVLADILIVLGAALIILALGLLFLWIFIWFIGGAIVGLIRGVVSLGAKWCYKEVAA